MSGFVMVCSGSGWARWARRARWVRWARRILVRALEIQELSEAREREKGGVVKARLHGLSETTGGDEGTRDNVETSPHEPD